MSQNVLKPPVLFLFPVPALKSAISPTSLIHFVWEWCLVAQRVKCLPAMQETWARSLGPIPGSGRSPGERKQQPIPVLLPGNSHGQRSLLDYSPWDHKESDTTERLHPITL